MEHEAHAQPGGPGTAAAHTPGPATATLTELAVLLVEDDPVFARLVRAHLGGLAARLDWVEDARAGLAALCERIHDVCLLDVNLPDGDGVDVLRAARAAGCDAPVILLTADERASVADAALAAGASDYVVKRALDSEALGRAVRYAVGRARAEAAVRASERSLRARLAASDRLASVGTLAAGVAHELNNPLAYVLANVRHAHDTLRARAGEAPDLVEALEHAVEGAERLRAIARDLKLFARGDGGEKRSVDVRPVLESALNMAWNEIRHRARLVKDLRAVPPVDASESRLAQVFLNLLVNAAQAIPIGAADHNQIRVLARCRDGRVVVEISDSGEGIAADELPRIFEPFFTTKPAEIGTGLGLSICQGIIHDLGGEITVSSTLGVGTTFTVSLPPGRLDDAHTPAPAERPAAAARAHVVVVDDEAALGKALRRALADEHDVVAVTDAREALRLVEAGEPVDLIISDLAMPNMTGMELYAALEKLAPSLAQGMVFMTGGAFTAQTRTFLSSVPNVRLEKPFEPAALRAAVRDRLQADRARPRRE